MMWIHLVFGHFAMAPLMVGATPPEEQVPQPREIDRGPAPARGDSGIVDGAPTWSPLEADEGDELVALMTKLGLEGKPDQHAQRAPGRFTSS